MSDRPLFLGIDLGTTNSAASMFDGTQIHPVRTPQGTTLTPSIVRIDRSGTVTVGAKARRMLDSDSDNVRGEFKRLMGTGQSIAFPASGNSLRPQELSAEILKSLRADVREQFGFDPARAVISAPALFELPQSLATSEAARLAGFERVELIQEPIASALAAGWTTNDAAGSWMVYDLGGGTFDCSLLETRDGLLRVVGHDGDNFLGGRDFDWVLVDFVLQQLSTSHSRIFRRSDQKLAAAIRKLKPAVEDCRIELTRAKHTNLTIPNVAFGEDVLDVDMVLAQEDLERLCVPLVDRSIAVCMRLLKEHGLNPSQISRMVLVGGPTVMPIVRRRLSDALGISFAEGLDPMTLVAQGAALYAASANLDARPADTKPKEAGRRVWLQYPAMTSDLTPYIAGRLSDDPGPRPVSVCVQNESWKSAEVPVSADGTFVIPVEVRPHQTNELSLIGTGSNGKSVTLVPSKLTIVHGMTLSDPPLSRAIGVALASDRTQVYLERGCPLPARRTFRHEAVETVIKGDPQSVLRIPIVQGEYVRAHQCRLVGSLEIRGTQLTANIPAGSFIEVTLEVDRGGRLSAQALTSAGQVFEEITRLLVPDIQPDALEGALRDARSRLASLYAKAFVKKTAENTAELGGVELSLAEVERDTAAARGGDADAAQKAKRRLLDIDAELDRLEQNATLPELELQARIEVSQALSLVSMYGSPSDRVLLNEAVAALQQAREARQVMELQLRIAQIRDLASAAYFKNPEAWNHQFNYAASRIDACRDLPTARKLVAMGREAMTRGDRETVAYCTEELWKLLPIDAQRKQMGHNSGLR